MSFGRPASDHRDLGAAHVRGLCSAEELVFEAGARQHDIERHAGGDVDERQHSRSVHELRVLDTEGETADLHVAHEALRFVGRKFDGNVDVGAEARHAVGNYGLRSEARAMKARISRVIMSSRMSQTVSAASTVAKRPVPFRSASHSSTV